MVNLIRLLCVVLKLQKYIIFVGLNDLVVRLLEAVLKRQFNLSASDLCFHSCPQLCDEVLILVLFS